MVRSAGRLVLVASLLAGCAASREYQCPEPIGMIIQDECDEYKIRYEAAQVKVGVDVGPAELKGEFGQEALRDPSELIQVMGARMMALCHDFNACRLTPADYGRRREEIDRTTTAIVAIGEQLRRPELKDDERRLLLERLMQLLGEPQPRRSSPAEPAPRPKPKSRKRAWFSSDPWMGSTRSPPVPLPVKDGYPRLIAPWGKGTIDHVWVPRSPDKPHHKKVGGYRPRVWVTLWGHIEADDQLEVRFHNGKKVRCPVGKNGDGVNRVRCKLPKTFMLRDRRYRYEVVYYRALDDAWATLGHIERQVAERENTFRFDHGKDVSEGWLMFLPEPRALPPDFECPHLYVTLQLREHQKATARCWVGDETVTGAVRSSRGTGQAGTFQDRPRYRQVKPGSSVAVKNPFVEWWNYLFGLPFLVPRSTAALPEGMQTWPPRTGEWRCRVVVDGVPVRELTFTVQDDGKLEPLPGQRGEPGDLVHPWWRVKTRILPNDIETVREDKQGGT